MNERAEILRRLQAGEITPQQAQQELLAFYISRGASQRDAGIFALEDIQDSAEVEAAPIATPEATPFNVADVPRPVPQPALAPDPSQVVSGRGVNLDDEFSGPSETPFGATRGLQNIAFGDILADRFPNAGSRVRSALGRQLDVIQPSFEALQGLGQLGGLNFREFANQNLGRGGIDPRRIASEVGAIFGRDDLSNLQRDFRDTLRATTAEGGIPGLRSQLELATQAALQGVPRRFAGATRRRVERDFNQFLASAPINPETGLPDFARRDFLPAFNRGFR